MKNAGACGIVVALGILVPWFRGAEPALFGQSQPKPPLPGKVPEAPARPGERKPVPDLPEAPVPAGETWRVVPSVTESTGSAKGRFVLYNVHTGESYASDNTMTEWVQLGFRAQRTTNLKQDPVQPLPNGSPK